MNRRRNDRVLVIFLGIHLFISLFIQLVNSADSVYAQTTLPSPAPTVSSQPTQATPPVANDGFAHKGFSLLKRVAAWVGAHNAMAAAVLWLVGFPVVWGVLLAFYPVALLTPLRLCSAISEISFFGLKFPSPEYVTFLWLFVYRKRVLDRWVGNHAADARTKLAQRDTVRDRAFWVPLPVRVEGQKLYPELSVNDVRPFFEQRQLHILIHGDGGTGKTSLACQIANWGLAPASEQRLRPHLMIPVILESDFVQSADGKLDDVEGLLREQIKVVTGARKDLPPQFIKELCSTGRVLIIIDSLSERSGAVRDYLSLRGATGPFQCVVFTSRTAETEVLKLIALTRLQTLRLQGEDLWEFTQRYLSMRTDAEQFTEREVIGMCERLSDIAGDRDVTAMLARMYTDMEITRKTKDAGLNHPQHLPGLMLEYVKQISEKAGYIT